jgi:hypothetical protein
VCGSEVDLGMKTTTKDMEKLMEGCDKMKTEALTREKTFNKLMLRICRGILEGKSLRRMKFRKRIPSEN